MLAPPKEDLDLTHPSLHSSIPTTEGGCLSQESNSAFLWGPGLGNLGSTCNLFI